MSGRERIESISADPHVLHNSPYRHAIQDSPRCKINGDDLSTGTTRVCYTTGCNDGHNRVTHSNLVDDTRRWWISHIDDCKPSGHVRHSNKPARTRDGLRNPRRVHLRYHCRTHPIEGVEYLNAYIRVRDHHKVIQRAHIDRSARCLSGRDDARATRQPVKGVRTQLDFSAVAHAIPIRITLDRICSNDVLRNIIESVRILVIAAWQIPAERRTHSKRVSVRLPIRVAVKEAIPLRRIRILIEQLDGPPIRGRHDVRRNVVFRTRIIEGQHEERRRRKYEI